MIFRALRDRAYKPSTTPKRLVLRLIVTSFPLEMLKQLADSWDDLSRQEELPPSTETLPPSLHDTAQGTTGEVRLDAAALHSFRMMFLLLDEWDQAARHDGKQSQDSFAETETLVDTETR